MLDIEGINVRVTFRVFLFQIFDVNDQVQHFIFGRVLVKFCVKVEPLVRIHKLMRVLLQVETSYPEIVFQRVFAQQLIDLFLNSLFLEYE
jgi:hypothetical protein